MTTMDKAVKVLVSSIVSVNAFIDQPHPYKARSWLTFIGVNSSIEYVITIQGLSKVCTHLLGNRNLTVETDYDFPNCLKKIAQKGTSSA